jgi:hypothetical protein
LAVASVAERHARRVHLRDGRKCEVRRPRLDENHVDGQNAGSICAT